MAFWEQVTLNKLGILKRANYIEDISNSFERYAVNFVSSKLVRGELYADSVTKYSKKDIKDKAFPINTVVIRSKGTNIYSSILKKPACLFHTMAGFVCLSAVSDPLFIKYCFDFSAIQESWKKLIFSFEKTNDTISLKMLLSVSFPNPPFELQQKIGRIIADYDLLLKNSKKQLDLLEKIKNFLHSEFMDISNYQLLNSSFQNRKKVFLESDINLEELKNFKVTDINLFFSLVQFKVNNLAKKQAVLEKIKSELIEVIFSQSIEIN